MKNDHHLPEDHIVAFVDILGFRALLRRMTRDPSIYSLVKNVLNDIAVDHERHRKALVDYERHGWNDERRFPRLRMQMTQFSDNVVMSKPINTEEPKIAAEIVVHLVSDFAARLLRAGVLVRGGIAKGWLYHEGNVLFGEGLVTAYELESGVARMPRIVVADDVVAPMSKFDKENKLLQDSDGFWFINVFSELWYGDQIAIPDPEQFNEVRRFLASALEEVAKAPADLQAKYRWVANQFDAAVDRNAKWPGFTGVEKFNL